ncbi:VOC family protein [Micromonospora sp. 067-2]|uniref:VOC family protein n=1 Tax=Micromonospora sp. 067-2 TaxID=2789270 RepID=UPI00397D29C5
MALAWKLVVDSAEPIALARFWAAALEYEIEDNGALIEQLASSGAIGPDAYVEIDGRRAFRNLAAIRHPEDPVQPVSGIGLGRRLLFQAVPEPKQVKNRLHVDLHAGPDQREATVRRLVGLGATVLREVDEPGSVFTAMVDPEGNEFDVQ